MPLRHYSHLIEQDILNNILLELNNYMFHYHNIKIMGKDVTQNRRTLYFGDVNFNYSGSSLSKKEFPIHLRQLMHTINGMFSIACNSCLINYYENGKENIGHHSDGKGYNMHSNNSVVTVSLGTSRVFEVKNKYTGEKNCITLEHGDLVIMDGDFQDHNTHSILKDLTVKDWRLSLTFRHL